MTSDELLKTVRLTEEDPDIVSDYYEMSSMAPEPTTSPLPTSVCLPYFLSRPHARLKIPSRQMLLELELCFGKTCRVYHLEKLDTADACWDMHLLVPLGW
jgi:hypothetical protein